MPDLTPYLGMLVMALIIIAALILGVIIYKLFNQRVRGRRGQRLGISEYHELDKTHRLVIVRRDDVEHLILIGGNQEFTIESNIQTGLMARQQPPMMQPQEQMPTPMRQAPRPPVFGERVSPLRPVGPTQYHNEDEPA